MRIYFPLFQTWFPREHNLYKPSSTRIHICESVFWLIPRLISGFCTRDWPPVVQDADRRDLHPPWGTSVTVGAHIYLLGCAIHGTVQTQHLLTAVRTADTVEQTAVIKVVQLESMCHELLQVHLAIAFVQ